MKKIAKIIIPLTALIIASALPMSYMFQGPLVEGVVKGLGIKVDPRYSGGEVLAKFLDPMDDDRGEGGLVYPDLPGLPGGRFLDVVKYTVHRPVLNTFEGGLSDFWQMDVVFSEIENSPNTTLGFRLPVVHIYIDVDGAEGGGTRTARENTELVAFDPAHPWDYMIHIDGFAGDEKGSIVSFDGAYERPVEIFFVKEKKTLYARVKLDDPGIKRILDGRPTYHYVVVGAFDPLSAGGFMPVAEKAGPRNGGGARSALTPPIYDWVEPEGARQDRILSSYDTVNGALAVIVPLEAKELPKGGDPSRVESANRAAELLTVYQERLARETAAAPPADFAAAAERLAAQGNADMEIVKAYYEAGMYEKAEEASGRILEAAPDHAGAATYAAMAIAGQSGQQSSPMKSLAFVNRAIARFDTAFPLCRTPEELLTLYLARGRYFAAIPESLFRKSAAAADDFLKAAAIIRRQGDAPGRAALLPVCYLGAAGALLRAGNEDEAEIYFHKAAEFKDLTTGQIVALLERGFVPTALLR